MQAIYDLAQHYMYTSPWRRRTMVGQKFHKVISVSRALKYRHQSCYESVKVHGSEEIKLFAYGRTFVGIPDPWILLLLAIA